MQPPSLRTYSRAPCHDTRSLACSPDSKASRPGCRGAATSDGANRGARTVTASTAESVPNGVLLGHDEVSAASNELITKRQSLVQRNSLNPSPACSRRSSRLGPRSWQNRSSIPQQWSHCRGLGRSLPTTWASGTERTLEILGL